MSDHERIWLEPRGDYADDRSWCQHDVWTTEPEYEGQPPTEYVRADIAAAEIERLQARVAELEGDFHTMTVEAFARGHAAGVNSVTGYAEGFAAAREMAARVCDGFSAVNPLTGKERGGSHQGAMLAAAIRALRPDGDA